MQLIGSALPIQCATLSTKQIIETFKIEEKSQQYILVFMSCIVCEIV